MTIKETRQLHHLSQEEFGKAIGVSRRTVRDWELGKTHPNIVNISLIGYIFNVDPEDIFIEYFEPDPVLDEAPIEEGDKPFYLTEEEFLVLKKLYEISDDTDPLFLQLAEKFFNTAEVIGG